MLFITHLVCFLCYLRVILLLFRNVYLCICGANYHVACCNMRIWANNANDDKRCVCLDFSHLGTELWCIPLPWNMDFLSLGHSTPPEMPVYFLEFDAAKSEEPQQALVSNPIWLPPLSTLTKSCVLCHLSATRPVFCFI